MAYPEYKKPPNRKRQSSETDRPPAYIAPAVQYVESLDQPEAVPSKRRIPWLNLALAGGLLGCVAAVIYNARVVSNLQQEVRGLDYTVTNSTHRIERELSPSRIVPATDRTTELYADLYNEGVRTKSAEIRKNALSQLRHVNQNYYYRFVAAAMQLEPDPGIQAQLKIDFRFRMNQLMSQIFQNDRNVRIAATQALGEEGARDPETLATLVHLALSHPKFTPGMIDTIYVFVLSTKELVLALGPDLDKFITNASKDKTPMLVDQLAELKKFLGR